MPDRTGQYGTLPIPTGTRAAVARHRAPRAGVSRSARTAPRPPHARRWRDTAAAARPRRIRRAGRPRGLGERNEFHGRNGRPRSAASARSTTEGRRRGASPGTTRPNPRTRNRVRSDPIGGRQRLNLVRRRVGRHVPNHLAADRTCAGDELTDRARSPQIRGARIRAKVVVEVLLEDPPHEVDRLIERIDREVGLKVRPERIEDLIRVHEKSGRVSRSARSAKDATSNARPRNESLPI